MKVLGKVEKFKVILVAGLVVIFILASFFDFSNRGGRQVLKIAREHLQDVADQAAYGLDEKLEDGLRKIEYTAGMISSLGGGQHQGDAQVIMDQMMKSSRFDSAVLLDKDWNVKYEAGDDRICDCSIRDVIGSDVSGTKSGISAVYHLEEDNEDVICIYSPVYGEDGTSEGVLAGIVLTKTLVDLMDFSGFGGRSYSYVIQSDGKIIMQTGHEESLMSSRDYYEFLGASDRMGISLEDLKSAVAERKSGVFSVKYGNQERIVCYVPSTINDWYIITAVSSDVVKGSRDSLNMNAFQLLLKTVLALAVLMAFLGFWMWKAQKLILESKKELESSSRKLELALQHTDTGIFEYNIPEDTIHVLTLEFCGMKVLQETIKEPSRTLREKGIISEAGEKTLEELLRKIREGQEQGTAELLVPDMTGKENWLRVSVAQTYDGHDKQTEAIGTIENITEEKAIEKRYAQEEKFRQAMLSETLSVWAVNLTERKLLSYTRGKKDCMPGLKSIVYDKKLIEGMCRLAHPKDKERVSGLLDAENLISMYREGIGEIKEEFRLRMPGETNYIWVESTVNLLTEPGSEDIVAFSYTKNIDATKKKELALLYESERDQLTGLYNRTAAMRMIDDRLSAEEDNRGAEGTILLNGFALSGLLMMDLDGFKEVNDKLGHQAGDELLRAVADVLMGIFRENDVVARLGGDEFVAFVHRVPSEKTVELMGQRVCAAIEEMSGARELEVPLSISIGIAFSPKHGRNFEILYKKADMAMYEAKNNGKSRTMIYKEKM
ncbi:diguanylate cyclase [Murimonas intestini]|uniref:diguanylate cyclase n=1 Tax=Murimonas intestini TaxID=1337051 RepID=UPI0011DD4819|nr:diguanylate cyclase [Murimonas intestini]